MKRIVSPLLLFAASVIWGFAFVAQDAASSVPAFTLGALRSIPAFLFLGAVILVLDPIRKNGRRLISRRGVDLTARELVGGAVCGVILALASALQQFGINGGTDGGKAGFITALYVVFVPIYNLLLGRRAPVRVWASVVIAAVGFYLLCIKDDLTVLPSDILVMLCALVFPIHILTVDRFAPGCDPVRMSAVQFFTAAAVNGVLALIFERGTDPSVIISAILPILFLGIASSGIAYTLQMVGQRGTEPAVASVILSLESVFAVVGTAMLLGSTLTEREYIGCGVILLAVILAEVDFIEIIKKKQQKKEKRNADENL